MQYVSQAIFLLLAVGSVFLFSRNIFHIRQDILLGKDEDFTGDRALRWKNMLLLAFGQKKMFRNPTVAFLHLFVYVGFVIINIEVLEIVLDGLLGTHRLFLNSLGRLYPFFINSFEILAATVLIACVIFLIRRNIIKLRRFISKDLDGWPRTDANLILVTEIVLMTLFLCMNAADRALQLKGVEHSKQSLDFIVSGIFAPAFSGLSIANLAILERACWWLHITGILAFLNYLPYSKHLHILLAFPNAYYARLEPLGEMRNMPNVQDEVKYAMMPELAPTGEAQPMQFGAKDAQDLSWKNLLDAYSCTECGRCSAACPANITGKLLSPRKIMMATRDRLQEVGKNVRANGAFVADGKTLVYDYITTEELRACTSCNACVMECPVSINPLEIILELRRSLVMEDSNAPQEWNGMFSNIENNFAPWKLSPDDRDRWAIEMES